MSGCFVKQLSGLVRKRQRRDFVNPYLDLEAVMDVGGDEEEDVAADDDDIFIDQGMFYYNSTQ